MEKSFILTHHVLEYTIPVLGFVSLNVKILAKNIFVRFVEHIIGGSYHRLSIVENQWPVQENALTNPIVVLDIQDGLKLVPKLNVVPMVIKTIRSGVKRFLNAMIIHVKSAIQEENTLKLTISNPGRTLQNYVLIYQMARHFAKSVIIKQN